MKFSRNTIFLGVIFFLYISLHFVNLDKRIVFGWDQEQFSNQIKNIVLYQDFTLLGPRVNNDKGFFLAPYFTYLLVPFYIVGNLHPSVLMYFLIITNLIFFFATYFILQKIFSQNTALLFLLFWPLHSMLLHNNITAWWPTLIPLGVILTWFLLWKIHNAPENSILWAALGGCLTFFMNMHFQFIFIIFFSIVFLFLVIKTRKVSPVNPFITAVIFLTGFTPLLLFDLRHDFLNAKLLFSFFLNSDSTSQKDFFVWMDVLSNFLQKYIFIQWYYLGGILLSVLGYFTYQLNKKETGFLSFFYKSHVVIIVATGIFFTLYAQRPSEYYFFYLAPFILIFIITILKEYNSLRLLYAFAALMIVTNGQALYESIRGQSDSLYYKDEVAKTIKKRFNSKKFHISYAGPPSTDTGFQYLLDWHGVTQSKNLSDPLIQVVRPIKKNDIPVGDFGVRIPKELK